MAVRSLTRPGLVRARDAVEMATPLAAATSRRVGGLVIGPRRAVGSGGPTGPARSPSWRSTERMATVGKRLPQTVARLRWSRTPSHGRGRREQSSADDVVGGTEACRRPPRHRAERPGPPRAAAPSDSAEVLVTSPDRNFVTLRITTEDGVVGLGDATLNGRELAVASYLSDHVVPLLIGRDAHRIEDTWQYLYRGAYWRRGPVTMAAIAAVDMALWDIKAKVAGMPLYQLLGGAQPHRRSRLRARDRAGPARAVRLDPRRTWTLGFRAIRRPDRRARARRRLRRRRAAVGAGATTTSRPSARPRRSRRTGTPAPTCATCRACSRRSATSSAPSCRCCTTRTTG